MRQAYITITVPAEAEFTEKKSRFIGAICPIADENQAQLFLAKRRSLHRDARHHVYAWLLGDNCQVERFSDDGEPMGTGGRPALAVLKQAGLQNVAVVVSRYFGGVLLGAGGLTRAYSRGAALAVGAAERVEQIPAAVYAMQFDYSVLGKVESWLADKQLAATRKIFAEQVCFICTLPWDSRESAARQLADLSSGAIRLQLMDEDAWLNRPV